MAYFGPERRNADRLHAPASEYEREYAFACRIAANWPPGKLNERLWVLMRCLPYYEDMWGEVDALVDLLARHRLPPWPNKNPSAGL